MVHLGPACEDVYKQGQTERYHGLRCNRCQHLESSFHASIVDKLVRYHRVPETT